MEVTTAVRRLLLAQDVVRGQVQERVFKWRLEEAVQETGSKAIVVSQQAPWASSDPVQTGEFPTLWVDCHADVSRDEARRVAARDAEDKAVALGRVVKRILHNQRGVYWGAVGSNPGLLIVSSAFETMRIIGASDQHGDEADLGDTVICRMIFALHTAPPG